MQDAEPTRYKLTLAYDGTDFAGWQKQEPPDPNAVPDAEGHRARLQLRTVQHVVEQAVRATLRDHAITVKGASRTDAGVHANGQVAAFTTTHDDSKGTGWPRERGCEPLMRALNSRLPDDVMVRAAEEAPLAFDPITGATSKAYTYTIHTGRLRPLWDRRFVYATWHHLDAAPMHEAAQHLVGEHDFAAFAQIDHGRKTTVRTIFACAVDQLAPEGDAPRLRITVTGSGFLYNMVRIIAGTLVEVGRGKLEPGAIPAIIASTDRKRAGPTLPPEGLRLEWIRYD